MHATYLLVLIFIPTKYYHNTSKGNRDASTDGQTNEHRAVRYIPRTYRSGNKNYKSVTSLLNLKKKKKKKKKPKLTSWIIFTNNILLQHGVDHLSCTLQFISCKSRRWFAERLSKLTRFFFSGDSLGGSLSAKGPNWTTYSETVKDLFFYLFTLLKKTVCHAPGQAARFFFFPQNETESRVFRHCTTKPVYHALTSSFPVRM